LTNNWNGSATLAGERFGIGTHIVTWTVTDNDGHRDECDVTVTVVDAHKPDIDCRDTLLALDAAGAVSIRAEDLLESADDCSLPLTYVFGTGESEKHYSCDDNAGTYFLTVKVTDAANITNTCSATVTVSDTTRPVVTLKSQIIAQHGETVTPKQVIDNLSDNCTSPDDMYNPDNGLIHISPNTFTCNNVGPATITVSDKAGNKTSATFTVDVGAMKPAYAPLDTAWVYTCNPADTLPANTGEITPASVTVCGSAPATVTYTNTSSQGADKTQAEYYNYDITRTWTVSAGAGNDSISVQIIAVRDTTPPLVEVESSATVYLGQDGKGTPEPGKVLRSVSDCADSVDVTITYNVSEFSCSDIGTPQTIIVTGTDPAGNVSAESAVAVTVLDTLPPVVTPVSGITLTLDASGAATLTPQLVIATLRDNCTDSSNIAVSFSREVFYAGDVGTPQSVWVYVEDGSGNKASVQVWFTVEDDIARETVIEKRIQGRDVANKGDTVTFILTVTNRFGGDRNLIIIDSLPAGLELVEEKIPNNSSVDLTKKVVTINHGLLADGASVSYAITVRVAAEGTWNNRAFLYRAGLYLDQDQATLNALQPQLTLTAKIREGDYTNTEPSPAVYHVPDNYRLVTTLENKGGATVDRIDVQITYDPSVQRFVGSSRGGEVTDDGRNLITWTVHDFEGSFKDELEVTFAPLIAATYTFRNEITTQLPFEDPSDNSCSVTVNQSIIKVPNVLTSDHPVLYIKEMDNDAIKEATMRVFNTWGNQVQYIRRRKNEDISKWFDSASAKVARGTYWYELIVHYENGMSYVIRDYVEVLK
jgi:uncharacterized repeat protein (TIGR01451 family)